MAVDNTPNYISLSKKGILAKRAQEAWGLLALCHVCAWKCPVNRLEDEIGVCQTGEQARISSFGPHLGEENPLRGWRGSGTIFFTGCNLSCQYCQNYDISQTDHGYLVSPEELARIMLELQARGCHNLNFVSPSHVVPQILQALVIAAENGLSIPLVYNTGGYDSIEMLEILDGIIDIYMPDMKYSDSMLGKKYSRVPDYAEINRTAVKEMHRQVGDLNIDSDGIAISGLLVRHLILPNNIAGTEETLSFIANELSKGTYINIMDQYYPSYRVNRYPELNRRISREEYKDAREIAKKYRLERLD